MYFYKLDTGNCIIKLKINEAYISYIGNITQVFLHNNIIIFI